MSQAGADTLPNTRSTRPSEIIVLLVLFAAVLLAGFPGRDLWTPDEPRYMEVAREMTVTGDYLVPHLSGAAYAEKPPVFFWLAAAFYKLGCGVNSGRLVALLASLGTLVLIAFYARRTLPHPAPLLAALVTLTSVLFLLKTRTGVIDPLLTFFITAALIVGRIALRPETRRRTLWWLAAYAAVALGILTKGPAAAAIPPLVLIAFALINRKTIRSGWTGHAFGLLLLLALTLGWLLPAVAGADAAYRDHLLGQVLTRTVDSDSHRQPFHYFILRYPIDYFPWLFILPLAAAWAFSRWRREKDRDALFLLVWLVLPFVLFSLVSGKSPGYLMPVFPAAGLLVAGYVSEVRLGRLRWPAWHRTIFVATAGALLITVIGAALTVAFGRALAARFLELPTEIAQQLNAALTRPTLAAWLVSCLGMLVLSTLALLNAAHSTTRAAKSLALISAALLLFSVAGDLVLVPRINRFKSPREFCDRARPFLEQCRTVYLLKDNMSGVYNLYTGRVEMPVVKERQDVLAALGRNEKVALLVQNRAAEKILAAHAAPYPVVLRMFVGDREMQLFLNWDPKSGQLIRPATAPATTPATAPATTDR